MAYLRQEIGEPEVTGRRGTTHSSRLSNASTLEVFADPLPDRPEWHGLAACGRNGIIGDDPTVRVRIMFPKRGDVSTFARSVCEQCQVQDECREARHARDVGVWFGTSGRMRRGLPVMVRCPCGEKFQRTRPGQTYCCDECRAEAVRASNRRYSQANR